MSAGLEIINTSGKVIIGRGYRHFQCSQKVTRQIPNGGSFILNTSNTPVIYYEIADGGYLQRKGYFRDNPTLFIGEVSHGGAAFFARSTVYSPAHQFGILYVSSPQVAQGVLISVTYYIFDNALPNPGSTRFGLQVFNAQGQCEFNATQGLMRVVAQEEVPANDNWGIAIPPGRKWAAMTSGNQYYGLQVNRVFATGMGNSGSRLFVRGIFLYNSNGIYVTSFTRKPTRAIIIDVTGL